MNRNLLKLTLLLLLGVFFANDLLAQEEPRRRRRRGNMTPEQREARLDKMMARMKDTLNLDDTQVTKLKELNRKMWKKMRAARKEYADDRQMMREEMTDIRIKYQKGVKKTLNKAQWKKFKKMEEARRRRRMERRRQRGNRGGNGGGE
ncbi:MAG TPA: hypothetical protein DCS93_33445 [Microscillaceae bacterium]|nr:hypothetical protein [Microscillaceae bacterium]